MVTHGSENVQRVLPFISTSDADRVPVVWSDEKKDALLRIAQGELPANSPIDIALAAPLLRCANGEFVEAERQILRLLAENLALVCGDNEAFISFINAVFVVQRLDLVVAMLQDRYGFSAPLTISIARDGHGIGLVRWDILPSTKCSEHRFTFDARAYTSDDTRNEILAFQWEFPLLAHYASSATEEHGSVLINRHDVGLIPGLTYCENRPEYFLIPDYIFVSTKGYRYARQIFRQHAVPWSDRKPLAFWRGATTGIPERVNDWTSLPRAKLCQLAMCPTHAGLFDVGFSSVAQFAQATAVEEIRNAGLMRDFVSWEEWDQYKYHIAIDGNSNPWSNLFQQLLTGSPVLRVESSRGLVQWFYDELRPWHNYVPVAPDMSDLADKVKWLNRNDRLAETIGQRGLELANRLSYAREMTRAVPVISAAFRYFNCRPGNNGPYGRPISDFGVANGE